MKRTFWCGLCLFIAMGIVIPVGADTPMDGKHERAMYRAMGGVDVLVDRFTPANASMRAYVLERGDINPMQIFSLDVDGDVLAMLGLFSAFKDWNEVIASEAEGTITFEEAIDPVSVILAAIDPEISSKLYADLFTINMGIGPTSRLLLGAYGELSAVSSSGAVGALDSDNLSGGAVDLGAPTEAFSADIYADLGFSMGMGKLFMFGDKGTRLALGVRGRGFMRKSKEDYGKVFPALVDVIDDLALAELVYDQGMGYGLDLYTVFALADPVFNTTIGLEWNDVLSQIYYDSGAVSDTHQMAASVMIYPLTAGGGNKWTLGMGNKWIIGMDVEHLFDQARDPAYQIGTSYQLGSIFKHLIPKTGIILGENGPGSKVITGGLSARLNFFRLSGALEFDPDTKDLNIGATLDLSTDYF